MQLPPHGCLAATAIPLCQNKDLCLLLTGTMETKIRIEVMVSG